MKTTYLDQRSGTLGSYRALAVLAALFAIGTPAWASGPLTASDAHGLMLAAGRTVCGAGENDRGQLGDGTNIDRWSPVTVARIAGATGVSTGSYHSLAVLDDGTVWSWGYNNYGELGNGSLNDGPTPMPVPGLTGMIAVAAGQYHSLGLKNDGTVWAWGVNTNGRLGDGTLIQRPTPVRVLGLTGVIAIAAGQTHSLALKNDGTVWAWGYNGDGELGNGTFIQSLNAIQVVGLNGVSGIAAGAAHSLALKSDGTVWTWGSNTYGQLGDGSAIARPNIVRAGALTGIIAVAGGLHHSLAVMNDGRVWAWGRNDNGQLGDSTAVGHLTPVLVSGLTGGTAVAAGALFSQALKSDGTLWSWGNNARGQLGNGTTTPSFLPVASSACAWGVFQGAGTSVALGHISASKSHTLALKNDTSLWAWGDNGSGQLGDGSTISRPSPVRVGALSGVAGVSTGPYHSLAVMADGTVRSWGYNSNGQLGDSTQVNKSAPLVVPGLTGMIAVAAGQYHSLGLKNDGTVWAWGYNFNGRLGDGTLIDKLAPVHVTGLTGIVAIAAGYSSSLALKSDGTVWAWGFNLDGELGNNTFTDSSTAVQVTGLTGVISIASGSLHGLALRNDGTVWTWGFNGHGELGDGTIFQRRAEIVRANGLTGVVAIAGGEYHSLAVKSDGTVWGWGRNDSGQLGDSSVVERHAPVRASVLANAVAVAGGQFHSAAIATDGSIWAWGVNAVGQFGAPAPVSSTIPVLILPSGYAPAPYPAVMQSPFTGDTLPGASVKFTWLNTGAANYWLMVGTAPFQNDIYDSVVGTATSHTVSGIPTNGVPIYVQLLSFINSAWVRNSYTYTAANILVTTSLNRSSLNFGGVTQVLPTQPVVTEPQVVLLQINGGSTSWTATSMQPWLVVSPAAGIGSATLTVSLLRAAVPNLVGSYSGLITVSVTGAGGAPMTIATTLRIISPNRATVPFGVFDTPTDNPNGLGGSSAVSGSISVTGWALDDIGVKQVTIWRDPIGPEPVHPNGYVYIGDSLFVPGARPDVEAAYPAYPRAYRAGWGYMLLTYGLPNSNGLFKLHAIATDEEGNVVMLGTKTIVVDNVHSAKPFGALDTPAPGQTIAGIYSNSGWALTPQPASIATNGSTIWVNVDSVDLAHPLFGTYRSDIAAVFPGYANSNTSGGDYNLDTTRYSNAMHTIAWNVYDNMGHGDGIGSRYFDIVNGAAPAGAVPDPVVQMVAEQTIAAERAFQLRTARLQRPTAPAAGYPAFRQGYDRHATLTPIRQAGEGLLEPIELKELDRLELHLPGGQQWSAGLRVGDELRALPIGSTFDAEGGIFYWQLGPAFLGEYTLEFRAADGTVLPIPVRVGAFSPQRMSLKK